MELTLPVLQQRWQSLQFTRKEQKAFLEDLSSLIKDGVQASAAVDTIRQISRGVIRQVATSIAISIARGQTLADGMQDWFARPIVEIIRAGESSGTLPQALQAAADSLSLQTNSAAALVNATLYPVAVIMIALIVTVFIKNSVLENFAQIKPISQWPSTGVTLYNIASIAEYDWWWLLLLLISVITGAVYLLQHYTGEYRKTIDNIPFLSLYRSLTAARFMETLGLLLSNGIALRKALGIMHRGAAPYLSWHLLQMEHRLASGDDNIADVVDTNLISDSNIVRLKVVAKGKGFEHALVSLGRQAHIRNAQAIALAGKISGGILLALGAVLAAMIVLGIYSVGSAVAA